MRNRLLLIALLLLSVATSAFASDQYRRHRYNHFKGLATNTESIVFVGNSITDMGNWPEAFGNSANVVSRGVSGGFSWEVRDNVYNWITGHPAKVFIKIGTNDLNVALGSPEGIAANIDATLDICRRVSPETKIYIQSIIPCNNGSRTDAKIRQSNQLLQEVCAKYDNAEYFDLYQYMGGVAQGWPLGCADNLHLTGAGYATWCHAIKDKVGLTTVYPSGNDAKTMQKNYSNTGVHGGRIANFSIEPTLSNDIIFVGDGLVQSCEWNELLKGDVVVKNHGTGWEVGSCDNTVTSNIIDATLAPNGNITRQMPRAIVLYACSGTYNATTYENFITKINGYDPNIQIYCLSLQPKVGSYATSNTSIANICAKYSNAHYIDIATELAKHLNDAEYYTEDLPYYMSYVTIAQQIAAQAPELGLTAMTTASAKRNYAMANATEAIYSAKVGTDLGQYGTAEYAAAVSALQALQNADAAGIELATTKLNTAIASLKASIVGPNAENIADRTFQINTPFRNKLYLVSDGAGQLVKGYTNAATTQYASTRWTISAAGNGSFNIQNRGDGSYLDPASLSSGDLKTVAAAPATGWTISSADATGTFVIKTADNKFLNMRGNSEGNTICNWAQGGTSDTGNQFAFVDVTDIEEVANPQPEALSGNKYTIRASFSSGAESLYLSNNNGSVSVSATVPTTDAGYWYVLDNGIRNAADGKYLSVDKGFKLYNEAHTLTFPDGLTSGTKCINESGRNGAINKAGTITNGQFSNNNRYNESDGGWSTDFVFELVKPTAYTIKLAGTNYYFNTEEVSDNNNKTYCISSTPEQFYLVEKNGGFTVQSVSSLKYAGYDHTNTWDFSNNDDVWTIEHIDGTETKILQLGKQIGFGVDSPGEKAGAFTNKPDANHPNCKYMWIVSPATATDALTYTVDKNNGSWTATNANGSWASVWTSTDEKLTLTASANNMQWTSDNCIDARSGQSQSSTYTLAVPEGYVIASYSFKATALTSNQNWSVGNNNYTVTTAGTIIAATDVMKRSVLFTLSGANTGTKLTDFTVILVRGEEVREPEAGEPFTVFTTPTSGVPYRIPAVAKNKAGDLIFVADYRYSKADIGVVTNGKLDLKVRKKYADGHWGPEKTLAQCIESSPFTSFGDPCIVADPLSDKVMVTSCCGNVSFPKGTHSNHQGWARFISNDGGETWSTHTDISQQVFDQLDKRSDGQIRCFFIGSGKISQSTRIKVGNYYRLYCAAIVKLGDDTNVNYAFFSDDFGEHWTLLGEPDDCPVPTGGDEPKAEELPDGSVVISSRSTGRIFNIFHFTDIEKGLGKWGNAVTSSSGNGGCYGTTCNGEIMILPVTRNADQQKTYIALQSIPAASDRRNVSIYYKELTDLASYRTAAELAPTWTKFQVSTTTSGYSTMCLDKDNHVAFFYEENSKNSGYDMVYKDFPVEAITNGAYSYSAMSDAERTAYLQAGVAPYFDSKEWAKSEPIASLVAAYKAQPTDANYCALNAQLNSLVLPSPHALVCPYASAEPHDGHFAAGSKVYTMYIKNQHYITTNSLTSGSFNVNNSVVPTSAEGYWIIAGNYTDGYCFYNVAAGATKVLGVTGSEASARTALYNIDAIPANVKTRFDYARNTNNGSTTGATFIIHGTANNTLNERAPYLALWDSGSAFTDHGSKIELTPVDYEIPATLVDIDRNGKYETSDVEALVRIVYNEVTSTNNPDNYNLQNADVNGDGRISIGDITCLIKLLIEANR